MNERPLTGVLLVASAVALAYFWSTGALAPFTTGLNKMISGQPARPKLAVLGGGGSGASVAS